MDPEIFLMFQADVFIPFHKRNICFSLGCGCEGRKTFISQNTIFSCLLLNAGLRIDAFSEKPQEISFLLLMRAPRFQHDHGLLEN